MCSQEKNNDFTENEEELESTGPRGMYYTIPSEVMDDPDLLPMAKLLYAILSGYAWRDRTCFPSNKHLAEKLGLGERHTNDLIVQLRDRGYIETVVIRHPKNAFKKRRIITILVSARGTLKNPIVRHSSAPPIVHSSAPPIEHPSAVSNKRVSKDIEVSKELMSDPPAGSDEKDFPLQFSDDVKRVTKRFVDELRAFNQKAKIPADTSKWEDQIDKMIRLDGHTAEEILSIIGFVFQDNFWGTKVLSTEKLRDKFGQLWGLMTKTTARVMPRDPYEYLKTKFVRGQIYNHAECTLTEEGIAFTRGMKCGDVKFGKYFSWKQVKDLCKNFGIDAEIPER